MRPMEAPELPHKNFPRCLIIVGVLFSPSQFLKQIAVTMPNAQDKAGRIPDTYISPPPTPDQTSQIHTMTTAPVLRASSPSLSVASTTIVPATVSSAVHHGNGKPCMYYRKSGNCKFGNNCRFSHASSSKPRATSKPVSSGTNTNPAIPTSVSDTSALKEELARKEQGKMTASHFRAYLMDSLCSEIARIKARILLQEELARTEEGIAPFFTMKYSMYLTMIPAAAARLRELLAMA